MRKRDELSRPDSCMSRAREDEMTFVLLGRDAAAPAAIRAWIRERVRLGKNRPGDPQIAESEECARTMEAERGLDNAVADALADPGDPAKIDRLIGAAWVASEEAR